MTSESASIKPIGPVRSSEHTGSLAGLPPLVLGGATFNDQYNSDPFNLPVKDIVKRSFDAGVCAIDTSAYYGPSEILLGQALSDPGIAKLYPRNSYFILTKAGRIAADQFDFSPEWIHKSVERSLERLHTDYLDVVYAHDVEFVPLDDVLPGIAELFKFKDAGVIRNVGVSGYPVSVLVTLCELVRKKLGRPIDVVLSYSNFNIQNRVLKNYLPKFDAAGVKHVLNGSPLSMSLLRSQPPHSFHPASAELKGRVTKAAEYTVSKDVDLADLSMRYALRNWHAPTVIGWSSLYEVDRGLEAYWDSQNDELAKTDEVLVSQVQKILGDTVDSVWDSGLPENYTYTVL
ncbi:NADP-dependent oxidoreductase domain-containing protein [Limtongia smithiae]|uniref:NADP-dependent oxidoreductase domain-containing protein n=1 Tax=Limtongia smithiae TaxID=1125753 RepID=UPI0034CF25C3